MKIDTLPLDAIAAALAADGYPSTGPSWRTTRELAALVHRAARDGTLLWTRHKLVTLGPPRLYLRPAGRAED